MDDAPLKSPTRSAHLGIQFKAHLETLKSTGSDSAYCRGRHCRIQPPVCLLYQMAHEFFCVPTIPIHSIRPGNRLSLVRRILRVEGKVCGHSAAIDHDTSSKFPRTSDCQIKFIVAGSKGVGIENVTASHSNEIDVEAGVGTEVAPQIEPVTLGHLSSLEMCEEAVMSLRCCAPVEHARPVYTVRQSSCWSQGQIVWMAILGRADGEPAMAAERSRGAAISGKAFWSARWSLI